MPAVFTVELSNTVKRSLKLSNVIIDFGDGYEQRANKNQAYSRANGRGGVTSYKGRNRFTITLDHLAHVNADDTKEANKLWKFYQDRLGGWEAFYFYNPAETNPPDATGANTTGRYLVRFEQQELELEEFVINLQRGGISMIEVRS